MHTNRLRDLRRALEERHLDALVTTFLPHVRYLSGFSGSNGLCVVTARRALLVTDGRYREQVRQETKGFRIRIARDSIIDELPASTILSGISRIAIEHAVLPVAHFARLQKLFPRKKFLPSAGIVESLASLKDEAEIERIRKAVAITDAVFSEMLAVIRPGLTENEIASELSYRQRRMGGEGDAFEPIVAAGDHAALPHAHASDRRLGNGELVIMDFGCRVGGYHSDLTRTVSIGKPSPELRKIYMLVAEAQKRALDGCSVPAPAKAVDAIARSHIRKGGFGRFFPHSLGHGLGLQIHEEPKISARSTATLVAGNVVTIEPGVYVPGLGGVRIEDDVVLGRDGPEILTQAPKDLIIL